MEYYLTTILVLFIFNTPIESQDEMYHCEKFSQRMIYCEGPILQMVQESGIFDDEKTFIDMSMKRTVYEIYDDYVLNSNNGKFTRRQLKEFLKRNFEPPGSEYNHWEPEDWRERPSNLLNIDDPDYRKWAYDLNNMWPSLTRKVKDIVEIKWEQFSLIYMPNPYVVPGGRIRELRYWDSYWIIKGLLRCGMFKTARGMLENLLWLHTIFQGSPVGNRIYYAGRVQPPIMLYIVNDYIEATNDFEVLQILTFTLRYEVVNWAENGCWNNTNMNDKNSLNNTLTCKYFNNLNLTRPDTYNRDVNLAKGLNDKQRINFYNSQSAALGSNWDLSSRWLDSIEDKGENLTWFSPLQSTNISDYLPVDLHSLLYGAVNLVLKFQSITKNYHEQNYFKNIRDLLVNAIQLYNWNDTVGFWFDYKNSTKMQRPWYYLSSILPLYTDAYLKDKDYVYEKVVDYLKSIGVLDYVGGVPVSLFHSSEQWDYPNVWPCYQYFLIMGLRKSPRQKDLDLAKEIARKFLESTYQAYVTTGRMFDKYDDTQYGEKGTGGDYPSQPGYGPTNGMILDLLLTYGTELYRYDVVPRSGLINMTKSSADRFCIRYVMLLLTVVLFIIEIKH